MQEAQAGLKLWGRTNSSNVQKVAWLLAELGLPYEQINVGGKYGGLDTPAFLALNPFAKIPALQHGDTAIRESHTILRYLAATFATTPELAVLWPATPAQQAQIDAWLDWTLASLQPAFVDLFVSFYRTPPAQHNLPQIEQALTRLNAHFSALDQQLAQRAFMAADTLTLADFGAGTVLHRYFTLDIQRPDLPHVSAWYQRLLARPAYATHVAVSFEELRG